jgi:hypothetical protein
MLKHRAQHVSTRAQGRSDASRTGRAHARAERAGRALAELKATCHRHAGPSSRPRRGTRGEHAHDGRHGQGRTRHVAPRRPLRREGPNGAGSCAEGEAARARLSEAARHGRAEDGARGRSTGAGLRAVAGEAGPGRGSAGAGRGRRDRGGTEHTEAGTRTPGMPRRVAAGCCAGRGRAHRVGEPGGARRARRGWQGEAA